MDIAARPLPVADAGRQTRTGALPADQGDERAGTWMPFDFFMQILGPEGGRENFLARLGPEANDAIDEFLRLTLAHEREEAPALATFLSRFAALELEIKRDMDQAEDNVRVMAVHAAKGREA